MISFFFFLNKFRNNDHSSETCPPSEILKPNETKLIKKVTWNKSKYQKSGKGEIC